MRIRTKLLLMLLGIAMVPLLIASWQGYNSTRDLGITLARMSEAALTKRLARELKVLIEHRATILRQQANIAELWVRVQADQVEKALAHPATDHGGIYYANDYDSATQASLELAPSRRHLRIYPNGDVKPMMISENAQVFVLAPGVNRQSVKESIARLSSMTPHYRSAYESQSDFFVWLYTGLANGVHSAFPGHGGYPPGYDPRTRPWYQRAIEARDTVWTPLVVDATSRQLIGTVSRPVYYPDGALAGVTAIDIPIQAVLEKASSPLTYARGAHTFTVSVSEDEERGTRGLRIYAYVGEKSSDWEKTLETRWIENEHEEFAVLLDDVASQRTGLRRMPYEGTDSLWVYAPVQRSTLLVVFPFAEVDAVLAQSEAHVREQTLQNLSTVGLISAILIFIVVLVAILSSRTVTEPIRHLAAAAKRLAQGDFEVRVPVKSKDEFGQLGETFNKVAPQLLDRIKARESLTQLSRYFSPNLAEQLTENPDLFRLGGERRDVTFVFTDLAGFTALVETSDPSDIVPVLNEYLDGMARIVFEHEGTVDKVVGDAIHAMFGAPLEQPDQAERAVRCALAMDTSAQAFCRKMGEKGMKFGHTRIGVNSGLVTVGNFGGDILFDYTAHGDAINIAARLESVNKQLGSRVCVSATTASQIANFQGRPIGALILKGRSQALDVFEPLSMESAGSPGIQAYLRAYELLAQNAPSALGAFQKVVQDYPDDPLARFHLQRLEAGESGVTITMETK